MALAEHGGRGQAKIKADVYGQGIIDLERLSRHGAVGVFLPDRAAFLDKRIEPCRIGVDPIKVLALQLLLIIARGQVVRVLGLRVGYPVLTRREYRVCIFDRSRVNAARLAKKLPCPGAFPRLFLFSQAIIPMIIVHRVRAHPHTAPRCATIQLRGISAHPRGQRIDDRLRELAHLINKRTSELERQDAARVPGLIQGQEYHFAIDPGSITARG